MSTIINHRISLTYVDLPACVCHLHNRCIQVKLRSMTLYSPVDWTLFRGLHASRSSRKSSAFHMEGKVTYRCDYTLFPNSAYNSRFTTRYFLYFYLQILTTDVAQSVRFLNHT